jgi:hypothetical protein
MRSKALAVQSILEMTENRAKWRPVSGHSPSSHVRIGSQDRKASGVVDDFAALYNPLENCGSLVIGGPPVWEQALGQREAAVTRFDSTKSTELPSTVAASRRGLPARTGMATASSKRGSKRSDGDSPFYPLRLHERDPLRFVVAGIPRFTLTSRAMATSLITTNRVKSLVNQVPYEDFALV